MKIANIFFVALFAAPLHAMDPANLKPAPTRPASGADVVADEVEAADTCASDKICVEGQLYNDGDKTANKVRLRVEIGGTKNSKPRYAYYVDVENPEMNPGDRQDFSIEIDRHITYKQNGEDKDLEVGKYNFRIVPVWAKPASIKNFKISGKKRRK